MREAMRDAAFASGIPVSWKGAVAGYVNGGDPYHPWTTADWGRFKENRKLPIFVRSDPTNGSEAASDAFTNLRDLFNLGVPVGCITALDAETARDPAYVAEYGRVMHWAGFQVWVYGSASTVFSNPPLDGYWVASYVTTGPFMYDGGHLSQVRATQYQSGQEYDSSTVKAWQLAHSQWWI